jgi:4-amino-4-deoxy-L-arabinose transferase-like glycosyltransferase
MTFCLVFFSVSQSKLPGYILPAIPAASLLFAREFVTLAPQRARLFGAVTFLLGLGMFAAAEIVGAARIHAVRDSAQVLYSLLRCLLSLAIPNILLGLGFAVSKNRRFQNSCGVLAVASLTCSLLFADRILRDLQPIYWKQKDLALQLVAHGVPPERTFAYLAVDRSTRYAVNFYLRREIPDWDKSSQEEAFVISGSIDCKRLRKEGYDCQEVPLGNAAEGWSVSHVMPKTSVSGAAGSGQPK